MFLMNKSKQPPTARQLAVTKYNNSEKGRYRALKQKAKIKGHELEITKEQYAYLVRGRSCYYCGSSLGTTGHGLDRIDNDKGYYPDNVIPCCGICNEIRGYKLTHVEMIGVALWLKKFRADSK